MNISHPKRTLAALAHWLYTVCQIETPHKYLVVPQWRPPRLSYHLSVIHVLLSESNRLRPPGSHVLGHDNRHIYARKEARLPLPQGRVYWVHVPDELYIYSKLCIYVAWVFN
jgi:hypothetical protein